MNIIPVSNVGHGTETCLPSKFSCVRTLKYSGLSVPKMVKPSKKEEPKLPKPTGWRLLVLPFKMKETTKGGLVLAETTLERQQVASQVGLVMAMGPQCYKDKERYPEGPWCKEKDWIMFARYAGSRIKIDGGEMRLLNDDEVLATIDSPEDILHEF